MATDPALQQANQALAPILAELARQKQQEQSRAANQQATATASASGLSDVLGGIAPQIQGDYQKASDSAFEYGRQLGLQYASGSNQDAGGLNEFLAKQGSPGQVKAAGDAGGTVLAGLGGLIPASGMLREGAAFTAAARNLPATALGRGQEQSAAIGRESLDRLSQLDALVRGEKTKLPGLASEIRSQQADQKVKQRAQKLNELLAVENLGLDKAQFEFDKNFKVGQANADLDKFYDKLDLDRQKLDRDSDQFNDKLALERLKSDRSFRLGKTKATFDRTLKQTKMNLDQKKYELALAREKRMSLPKDKGGFTQKQKRDMAQIAFETASDDFKGYKDDDGNDVPPRPPVETLRDLIAADVPFSVAIKAIQRFARGKKPAGVDAETWALWRATLKWTKK